MRTFLLIVRVFALYKTITPSNEVNQTGTSLICVFLTMVTEVGLKPFVCKRTFEKSVTLMTSEEAVTRHLLSQSNLVAREF